MRPPAPLRRPLARLLSGLALLLCCAGAASALTVTVTVTPAYLREHAAALSLKVARRPDGLLAFTVARTVPERRYFVARLLVRRGGKALAETSTPSYGTKDTNTFFFALAPESLAEAAFALSEAHLSGAAESPIPLPGTIQYRFRLRDHVPRKLLAPRAAR